MTRFVVGIEGEDAQAARLCRARLESALPTSVIHFVREGGVGEGDAGGPVAGAGAGWATDSAGSNAADADGSADGRSVVSADVCAGACADVGAGVDAVVLCGAEAADLAARLTRMRNARAAGGEVDVAALAIVDDLNPATLRQLLAAGFDDAVDADDSATAMVRLEALLLRRHATADEVRRLRVMYRTMNQFMGKMRPDGTLTDANPASLNALGLTLSDVVGKKFWDTPWWSSSAEMRERLREATQQAALGVPARFMAEHVGIQGKIYVDFTLTPVRDREGRVVAIVPEGKNITERVEAERQVEEGARTLKAVLSTLREGVVFQDVHGSIRFSNEAANQILGLGHHGAVGRDSYDPNWASVRVDGTPWPGEDHPSMVALRTGEPVRGQIMGVRRPDGERVWICINAQPLPHGDGRAAAAGVVCSFWEVTEQLKAEQTLAHNEAMMRRVTEHMPMGFWRFDRRGAFVSVNAAGKAVMPLGGCIGQTPQEAGFPPEIVAAHAEDMRMALEGKVSERLVEFAGQSGAMFLRMVTAPDVDASGQIVGALSFGTDMTRETQQLAAQQAHTAWAQRLVGIASHDLRSPLQVMCIAAQRLQADRDLSAQNRVLAQRLLSSVDRATRLVSDLLDVTLAKAGVAIPMKLRRGDPRHVVAAMVDEIRATAPGRTLTLTMDDVGEVAFDTDRIAQVVANLLHNAVAYGLPDAPIDVALETTGALVEIAVCNQGEAIPEAALDTLFEPMRRARSSLEGNAHQSLGLGLFIVREIMRGHGGDVRVSSSSAGTKFVVAWPTGQRADGMSPTPAVM